MKSSGARKLERLCALARSAHISVCVDDAANVADLARAAQAAGIKLDVLVEVNVGANRCGVEPGEPALALASAIVATDALRFAGIHAYHGAAQHLRTTHERSAAIAQADRESAADRRAARAQLACTRRSSPARAPVLIRSKQASRVYNELQPGSYVFMDADYGRNLDEDGQPIRGFQHSLFIPHDSDEPSDPHARRWSDAGLKAHSVDSGMPTVCDVAGARYLKASD
jgi:D-serine deaminase-like pyridoxal phosphate-dependent protein